METATTADPRGADDFDDVWRVRHVDHDAFLTGRRRLPADPRCDLMDVFIAWRAQRLDEALDQVLAVLDRGELTTRWQIRALSLQGILLGEIGLEHQALQIQLRQLELAECDGDLMALAIVTHDIGITYRPSSPQRAQEYLRRALAFIHEARPSLTPGTVAYRESLALEAIATLNLAQWLDGSEKARRLEPAQALADAAWPSFGHVIRASRVVALLREGERIPPEDLAQARLLEAELPRAGSVADVSHACSIARATARMAVVDEDQAKGREVAVVMSALESSAPSYIVGGVLHDLSRVYEMLGDLPAALAASRRRADVIEDTSETNARRSVRALEVWHRTQIAEQKAATAQATVEHMRATLHELHRDRERLRARSSRDVLTGLWNRGHLDDVVLALDPDAGHQVALIDVDRFKHVNDSAGHAAGDDVLRRIADAVQDVCGPADTAVRYGGDEFVVVRPASAPGRLADALAPLTRLEAHRDLGLPVTTTSIGVAVMGDDTFTDTLDRADRLMYQAKRGGGGQVVTDPA